MKREGRFFPSRIAPRDKSILLSKIDTSYPPVDSIDPFRRQVDFHRENRHFEKGRGSSRQKQLIEK